VPVELGFDVISVKQVANTRRSPEDHEKSNLPLFLLTVPGTKASQVSFKLTGLCYIHQGGGIEKPELPDSAITAKRLAVYGLIVINFPAACGVVAAPAQGMPGENKQRVHTGMLQLQAGVLRGTPSVQLLKLQPREGRGPQTKGTKNTTGRVFSSNYTTPGLSFAAALRNKSERQQQPHPHRVPLSGPATVEKPSVPAPVRQQDASQRVPPPDVNSLPLDNLFRAVSVVQRIMTEFNGAVLGEARIVLNLMK
jgi:hypothetical protein